MATRKQIEVNLTKIQLLQTRSRIILQLDGNAIIIKDEEWILVIDSHQDQQGRATILGNNSLVPR